MDRILNDGFRWMRGRVILRTTSHAQDQYRARVSVVDDETASAAMLDEICAGRLVGKAGVKDWRVRGVFVRGETGRAGDVYVESTCRRRLYVLRPDDVLLVVVTVLTDGMRIMPAEQTPPPAAVKAAKPREKPVKAPPVRTEPTTGKIAIRVIPDDVRKQPQFVDLTGTVYGRARVLGLAEGGGWVCECLCGEWFGRGSQSIRRGIASAVIIDGRDRCDRCTKALQEWSSDFRTFNERYPTDDECRAKLKEFDLSIIGKSA